MNKNLTIGIGALEYAASGGQANLPPEVAQALLQEFADLRGLCGWAADDVPKLLRTLNDQERRDCDELIAELLKAARDADDACGPANEPVLACEKCGKPYVRVKNFDGEDELHHCHGQVWDASSGPEGGAK